jgi:hypothetical protein
MPAVSGFEPAEIENSVEAYGEIRRLTPGSSRTLDDSRFAKVVSIVGATGQNNECCDSED